MRHKADKLEKGKWYCDIHKICSVETFLKYDKSDDKNDFYSEMKGFEPYFISDDGSIKFIKGANQRYLPTKEDIEKYNLNETE